MTDTTPAHVCQTPSEGLPGDEFTCPCGRRVVAIEPDYSGEDGLFIEWTEATR